MFDSIFIESYKKLMGYLESKPALFRNIEKQLSTAKTDAECVAILAPLVRKVEINWTPDSTEPEKNEMKSQGYRLEGNKYFQAKQYENAVINYNNSICLAPQEPNMTTLSLAFANRAVALKALGHFYSAIEDCKLALQCGYPEESQYKIYKRLGEIFKSLNMHGEAKENFNTALSSLAKAKLTYAQKSEIENQITQNMNAFSESEKDKDPVGNLAHEMGQMAVQDRFQISYGRNTEMPAASDCIKLAYNKKYGRHLVATRDINPGDVLLVEEPYAAVLYGVNKCTNCSYCFKRSPFLLPCSKCSQVMYCSTTCLDTAWKSYHEFECPYITTMNNFNPGWGTLLTLRIIALNGTKKLSDWLAKPPPPKSAVKDKRTFDFNSEGQFTSNNFLSVYYLDTKRAERPPIEIIGRGIVANYYRETLRWDFLPNCDELGGLLLQIPQSLSIHVHEFRTEIENKRGVERETDLATGLYMVISLINHSCDPNIFLVHQGRNAAAIALKPIAKGGQIFINYRTHFLGVPKSDRQHFLKTQMFIDCRCEACVNNWPLKTMLPSLFPLNSANALIPELVDAESKMLANCSSYLSAGKVNKIDAIIEILKILDKHGERLTTEYHMCQTLLRDFFYRKGNFISERQ